jgi:hypothetical protein
MRWARDRRAVATAAIALVIGALYFWTAFTSPESGNYYGLLTDGFVKGQTSLPVEPVPELLALADPYDPVQNAPWRLHDASLYQGKYYLYFGPTPVLLVYLPLRAVGIHASEALAAAVLGFAGFLFALALMRFLIDRYRPRTSLAAEVVAGLLLGIANVVPFILRRPAVYEVAIAGGYCCLLAGLHLTLTGVLREKPSLGRLAGGSLALGLAVGARPNLVVALPVWIWAWWRVWGGRDPGRRPAVRLAAAALGPLAACLGVLALYNLVRFGSPTEFGSTYQLAGVNMKLYDRFSLDRIAPGAFSYFLAPPRLDVVFPFVHLDPRLTGILPDWYAAGVEPVAGLLAIAPVLLAAFAAPAILVRVRARGGRERESMVLATLLLGTALLVTLVPVLSFDAATQRYEVDFATLLLFASLLVLLWLFDHVRRPVAARVALHAVVWPAAALSIAAGLAFSITGYYDGLRATHPGAYRSLENAFGFIPSIAAEWRGHPVVLHVDGTGTPVTTTTLTVAGTSALTATFTWNTAVPPGGSVIADVQSGGGHRAFAVTGTPQTVPVALHRGINTIMIAWSATVAPAVPAGFSVTEVALGPVARDPAIR